MKKLSAVALALSLAVSLSLPAAAKGDGIRWLDFELPEDLAEQIREDQREEPGYYYLNYVESMDLLSVNQYETYGDGWVFDLKTGEQTDYFEVSPVNKDLIVFTRDNGYAEYGLMDSRGEVLVDPVCFMPDDLGGGLFGMISRSEGEAYLLNARGEIVETYEFDDSFRFDTMYAAERDAARDWLCPVTRDEDTGLINAEGELVIPFGRYRYINEPVDGLIAVENKDDKWGLVDGEGDEVLPFAYNSLWVGSDGLISARDGDMYGVIDAEGDTVIPFEYNYISYIDHGLVEARIGSWDDGSWGVLDLKGNTVVPFEYESISLNGDRSVILVYDDDSVGLLDLEGNELLPVKYDSIYMMGEDRFSVIRNGRCGIVDRDGEYVFGPVRGEMAYLQGDMVVVLSDANFGEVSGIFTLEGEELLSADDYDDLEVRMINSALLYAVLDGEESKMGAMDAEGKELLPAQYDIITPVDNDNDGFAETYVVVDGQRVGLLDVPKPASRDRDRKSSEGFPWLWVGIGAGAVVLAAAGVTVLVAVSRKKKRVLAGASEPEPIPYSIPVQEPAPVQTPAPGRSPAPGFCPACGTRLSPDNKFCPNCGRRL